MGRTINPPLPWTKAELREVGQFLHDLREQGHPDPGALRLLSVALAVVDDARAGNLIRPPVKLPDLSYGEMS